MIIAIAEGSDRKKQNLTVMVVAPKAMAQPTASELLVPIAHLNGERPNNPELICQKIHHRRWHFHPVRHHPGKSLKIAG